MATFPSAVLKGFRFDQSYLEEWQTRQSMAASASGPVEPTSLGMTVYRLISTAFVVIQYLASMLAFSHFGRDAGSFR